MSWLRHVFHRSEIYDDLAEEMRLHLEEKVDRFMAEGMSRKDAESRARREFGNATLLEERGREVWQWRRLEQIWADAVFAVRQLRKSPTFTFTCLFTLALGIGANTAVFSVIDTILLHPLPYLDPGRLALVSESLPKLGSVNVGMSSAEYLDYQSNNRVFAETAAYTNFADNGYNLTGSGQPVRVNVARISASALPLLGVVPSLGRNFTSEEDRYPNDHVALLSHSLWQSQFGADSKILGRVIRLNDTPYTVVAVMPASFQFPRDGAPTSERPGLWLPMAFPPQALSPDNRIHTFGIGLIGRLKPGVSFTQAQQDMQQVASAFMRQYANIYSGSVQVVPHVSSFSTHSTEKTRPILLLLASAVVCLLLIACANVASLLLARANARGAEMALRVAVGASRTRILSQCLVESCVLAFFGASAGVLLAVLTVAGFRAFGPESLPRLQDVTLDPVALVFTFGVAFLASILFGFAPAWKLSHVDPQTALRGASQVGTGRGSQRGQDIIASSEIALALILLVVGGLLLRSFRQLVNVPFGFDPDHAFVVRTVFDKGHYPDNLRRAVVQQDMLNRLSQLPGITAAAEASHLPLSDSRQIGFNFETSAPTDTYWTDNSLVSPGYFHTMGITLLQGRDFTTTDRADSIPVAIVSQAFAQRFFPHSNPIGHRIMWGVPSGYTIIGVVGDVRISSLDAEPAPMTYLNLFQVVDETDRTAFILRGPSANSALLPAIRQSIWSTDNELPLYDATTLRDLIAESLSQRRFTLYMLAGFAFIALALSAVGISGVISYLVTQRNREFGVRIALGANRSDVMRLVLSHGMKLAVAGCTVGMILAEIASHFVVPSLYQTSAYDPVTLGLVTLLLFAVVLLAVWMPARRASRVEPMQVLRSE